jgi:hypothetical protein
MARIASDTGSAEDDDVRFLIGVLVIALVAMSLPGGACCVSVKSASHACCRIQCLSVAPAATIVKAPVVFAFSIAPAVMRVAVVVSHQHPRASVSTRGVESVAPLPLRI